ncbi:MAG TPA: nitroreductase family protein [Pseudolabrys sp.]|nr:nitroreductase family protein [Pseudolabrys sp.]
MTVEAALGSFIGRRRSIRRYRAGPIARSVVERLLLAATQAPSAHNRQPWRFAVIDDYAAKATLAAAMGQRLRQDRTSDGDDPQVVEADVSRSFARITEAPVVIVVCADVRDMDQYADDRRRQSEFLMAVQSAAMAAQNLLLAAEQERLGACVMCAPLFCPDAVMDALDLPQGWQAQMLITIGQPDSAGKNRPRLSLAEVTTWFSPDQPAK